MPYLLTRGKNILSLDIISKKYIGYSYEYTRVR